MAERKPTVVLVHGGFAESASWDLVIERCQTEHHQIEPGFRPSFAGPHSQKVVAAANPLRSVGGDAAYVRDVIARVGGLVVLVGHAYGGFVITEAAAGNESVVGLVYVNGFAPEQGESAFGLSAEFPGSSDAFAAYPISTGGVEFAIKPDRFHHTFAADVPARRAAGMGATQRPVTEKALTDGLPTDRPAWKSIPSWFVFGELDRIIPAALHRFMADRAGSRGTLEIPGASHALMVSNPDAVAATILAAVDAVSAATSAV